MKLALIQNGDTPQLESTAHMLRVAGYESRYCGKAVRDALQAAGCDTVISLQSMLDVGYDPLDPSIREASLGDLDRCDLFLEIKVRNLEKIWARWPRLRNRTAWLRVNGGRAEHVIRRDTKGNVTEDCGDETRPPCPVITAPTQDQQPHGGNTAARPVPTTCPSGHPSRRVAHRGIGDTPLTHN